MLPMAIFHIFSGMRPHQSIPGLMQNVKTESSKCPPERNGQGSKLKNFVKVQFGWQDASLNDEVGQGYGAFSYSKSHVFDVIRYVQNQEIHHR